MFISVGENDYIKVEDINRVVHLKGTTLWNVYFHAGTIKEMPIKVEESVILPALKIKAPLVFKQPLVEKKAKEKPVLIKNLM